MPREPSAFLNLDLELRCREDLAPLVAYFDKRAMVLYSGISGSEFQLTVEPLIGGHAEVAPDACTAELLPTLSALPPDLRALFQACHVRVFDYGFDGGIDEKPFAANLSASQVGEVSRAGIAVRITVYPYRTESTATVDQPDP